jgi:hypothetical protein
MNSERILASSAIARADAGPAIDAMDELHQ